MAKWNDQRAKSEEAGLKNYFRMKEALSQQKNISSNANVLSNFANRCLELIGRGNNTFQLGWDEAIQELIAAGKIEAECGADGIVRVRKIA